MRCTLRFEVPYSIKINQSMKVTAFTNSAAIARTCVIAMAKRKMTGDVLGSGGGILMILSPAKTLDLSPLEPSSNNLEWAFPSCDDAKTMKVASALRGKGESGLSKILGISSKLAKTAHEVS